MKKRFLSCVLGAVAALSLASCGFNAEKTVANFKDSVDTTVKLTYNANYDVDVVRDGDASGMASFEHEIRAKSVIEMDLGSDLYIKVKKESQDLKLGQDKTVTEEIVYKKDGKYYYQTSSAPAVEVEDAKAKVAEVLANITYEQVGGLTLDTLVYNSLDKEYELKVFGLSETFTTEELADPVYSKNDANGLHVEYKPEYIGYQTDGGISDFKNEADGYAAVINIDTNDQGFVTSWKEEYNKASLLFAIMSNPPTVTISGERSFTATYGEALTKAESVPMTPSTAVYEQAAGGTFVVKTFAMGDFGNMKDVANGGSLEVGKIVGVKVTPAAGKEVDKVTLNGSDKTMIDPVQAGGYYCFNVAVGENKIVVSYKDAPKSDAGTVTIPALATAKVEVFTCAPFAFQAMTPVANGGEVTPGNWICVKVTPAGSNTVASVKHNGSDKLLADLTQAKGFYCFTAAKGENKLEVAITGEDVLKAQINVTNESNIDYQLQSFTYAGAPSNYQVITDNQIVPGAAIFGAIVVNNATPVTVTVNGVATSVNIPNGDITFYCFSVKTADTFNVVITPAQ